jgi:hypothetical protein
MTNFNTPSITRNAHLLYLVPFPQSTVIPPRIIIQTLQNIVQDPEAISFESRTRPTNQNFTPRYIYQIGQVDTNVEDFPPITAIRAIHRPIIERRRGLQEEWALLRQRIDDDTPLYCSDMEHCSKNLLIIAAKYVEDKTNLLRARENGEGDTYGLESCLITAWEAWQLKLDSLFSTEPLQHWRNLRSLQAMSKMELILMLERVVRGIKHG